MQDRPHLQHLLICIGTDPRAQAEAAAAAADPDYSMFHPGILPGEILRESPPRWPESIAEMQSSLLLVDDPVLAQSLAAAGWPVIGYLYPGSRAVFHGVPYVLSEIDNIDVDTYEKVFERLHHLPWTILTTKRCIVREMCLEDLDGLYQLYDDPAAQRFLEGPGEDRIRERNILKAYIDKVYTLYGYGYWAVVDRRSGELIGRAGFEPYQGHAEDVSVGYLIRRDRRRQGIASEVVGAVLNYGLQYLDFPGIIAETAPDNTASIRLLCSLGFGEEKRLEKDGRELVIFRYRGHADRTE